MSDPLVRLAQAIGYNFHDPQWLQQALTHRSVGSRNNERLEFLGDALLNAIIAGELFTRYPDLDEGGLSRLRASLVNQEALADVAVELDLGTCLQLAPGEAKSGGQQRRSIQADAVEAIIGAIFQDGGYESAQHAVLRLFGRRMTQPYSPEALKDSKTRLQELLQARNLPLPVYQLEGVSGKEHAQTFLVSCRVESLAVDASASAGSRRGAEQEAARQVLKLLQRV